jgi:CRISPR system Cascade subunit CasC
MKTRRKKEMMKNNNLYIDLHVLQTIPPSNINRDDTGSPKTAVYGGAIRSRVSSQAWKKAIRDDFRKNLSNEYLGKRTLHIVDMVADEIRNLDGDLAIEKSQKLAEKALKNAGLKIKSIEKGTEALFFLSEKQAKEIAKLIVKEEVEKSEAIDTEVYKAALKEYPSIDMALFGRMVASDPSLNYDAACQVAHAISTHAVATEYDYFTAVDDLASEDSSGAGHIGVLEYNSSTLYRYATINVSDLEKHLNQEVIPTVIQFIKSFITSMPTGKQNTFANRTLPYLAYVTIRNDQPISLVGAFERPVESSENGYEQNSVKALEQYTENLYNSFASAPQNAFTVGIGDFKFGEKGTMKDLLTAVEETLTDLIGENKE